ncbi:MAG: hypothetical protein EOM24_02390 [Chloroflexia bacterium]|nr:hypothetical protein [Chloroflexia bacterium]
MKQLRLFERIGLVAHPLFASLGSGLLVWGPLAGRWPVAVLVGVVVGLIFGWLRWRQQAKPPEARRRQRWVLWLLHGLLVLGWVAAVLLPLYRLNIVLPATRDRQANFDRLWRAMDVYYPYFALKGIAWDEVYQRYAPQVAATADDAAYWKLVAEMLAELQDGHTNLQSPARQHGRIFFGTARVMGTEVVVDQVSQAARQAGLAPCAVLVAIDGRPLDEALDAVPTILTASGTPHNRRALAAFNVLSSTTPQMEVTLLDANGQPQTVTLIHQPETATSAVSGSRERPPAIQAERLPSGLGLIKINAFWSDDDLVAAFDAALKELFDAPGLIIDVRGNGGGNQLLADQMAARLLDEPFTYGRDHFAGRMPQRGWLAGISFRLTPRAPIYRRPVAVLIDERSFSTTEQFVVALVDSGRATTVGRPTGGGSGNPVRFDLTGGAFVRFSTADFRRTDGRPTEGMGLVPDLPVNLRASDCNGPDRDREAAEALLLGNAQRLAVHTEGAQ